MESPGCRSPVAAVGGGEVGWEKADAGLDVDIGKKRWGNWGSVKTRGRSSSLSPATTATV